MSVPRVLFLLFASLALTAATRVVTSRRVFHAALWLIISFFGVAAIYLLLAAPFMAGVQLFLYIGGVAVLTVIAIMVTKGVMRLGTRVSNEPGTSLLMAVVLFGVMVWMIVSIPWQQLPLAPPGETDLAALGEAMVDPAGYLLPFEVVSLMLLVVMLGSLYLGKGR